MTEIFSKNGVSLERLQTLAKVVRAGSIALAAKGDPNAPSLIILLRIRFCEKTSSDRIQKIRVIRVISGKK